jgi:pimeloyl-ACP methyl ester carboxylesterase
MGENHMVNRNGLSVEPRLLRISDKLSLRYQKSGKGPPLVLLHTIRTQLEYFRALAPLLAEKFTVFALDLPGHGHSPIDRSAQYDEPYMRKGVVGFLVALDLRDVTIVGESIGAVLALTAAVDVPERIRAVYALEGRLVPWMADRVAMRAG